MHLFKLLLVGCTLRNNNVINDKMSSSSDSDIDTD